MKGRDAMTTDLFQAIRRDGPSAMTIVASTPEINVRNDDQENPLHVAIAFGNQPVVDELIKRGIDVNAQDSKGQTPLHYAATYQNVDAAERILSNGGDISVVDLHGNSALWTAVLNARGKYEFVEVILRHGGRRFAGLKNKHGKSPADIATQFGDKRLIELLKG